MTDIESKGLYMGIDPGKSGAFALIDALDPYKNFVSDYFPKDETSLCQLFLHYQDQIKGAVVETFVPFGVSKTSMCVLARNVGLWEMCLMMCNIPYTFITAATWQKAYFYKGFIYKGNKKGRRPALKEHSLKSANALFTNAELNKKKDDGRADALHMALAARDYFMDDDGE